jgi:SNF2 family DNA or RNA helicase
MQIELTEEQKNVLEIIKEKKQFGIFLDMGVGKTALILSLIEHIVFDKLEELRTLIIAPATVANQLQVWQEEIKKWENFSYFDYTDMSGTEKKRVEKLSNNNSITIMSDALVVWWFETYGNLDDFDMIIIDESSRFKSHKSKKFKRLASMIRPEKQRIYELSGTPVPNGWQDIWSQIYLLDKGERLGKSYWKYIDRHFTTFGYRKYLKKIERLKISKQIEDICVFADSSQLKLPKRTEEKIMLNFPKEKQQKFDEFEGEYFLEIEKEEIAVLSKQILINKCLQLSNGCIYHGHTKKYKIFDDSKIEYVKKYRKENPEENILISYPFRFDKHRLLELDGAEAIEKYEDVQRWNRKEIKVGIISPYSFQFGGNLQYGGYTLMWFGLVWNLELFLQLNKRLHRPGQTHEVKIFYIMMKNTWDEYVYKTVVTKEISQGEFLKNINIKRGAYREKI